MFDDDRYARAAHAAVAAVRVPPAPLAEILRRAAQTETVKPRDTRLGSLRLPAAVAAAAVLALSMPLVAPGLTQSVEQRLVALLGWTPPPAPPKGLVAARAMPVTLQRAQKLASFTIVPPVALPADVTSTTIAATPSFIYSKSTHAWTPGPVSITFSYRRAGGRSFFLTAEPAASAQAPTRYIYDADTRDARGLPKRFERFSWRNGDQTMEAIAQGVSASEIITIRTAMHGNPVMPAASASEGQTVKLRLAPKP